MVTMQSHPARGGKRGSLRATSRDIERIKTSEAEDVKTSTNMLALALCASGLAAYGQDYTTTQTTQSPAVVQSRGRSPGGDVGSGAGDIGKGAGRGVGTAAKHAGKGAGDLVTLHPLNAAGEVGKGAAIGGKDVGVGAAKGTGKILKGTGRGIKKIF